MENRTAVDQMMSPVGKLVITVRKAKTGEIVKLLEYKNLILNKMKAQLSYLLSVATPGTRYLNRMQFGTGTTAAAVGDLTLESPITPAKSITTVSYPTPTSVMLVAFLLETEANGFAVTEAGLLCADGTLVARRVFGSLAKTVDFIFQFNWTISF